MDFTITILQKLLIFIYIQSYSPAIYFKERLLAIRLSWLSENSPA